MKRRMRTTFCLLTAFALAFSFMACGGGGGGGSDAVTYSGNTDPAVADSTNAVTLADYSLGVMQAGSPLADAFLALPSSVPTSLAVQSLSVVPLEAYAATTTVTIPVPAEAILYGNSYSEAGTGAADLNGSLTLYLGADSAEAATWYVTRGSLNGSIVYSGFSTDSGPTMTGTVSVSDGGFYFYGSGQFDMPSMSFLDDPGDIVWNNYGDLTFSNIAVSYGSDSWSLGQGDWRIDVAAGSGLEIDIYSMTVEYAGSTYRYENTYQDYSRTSRSFSGPYVDIPHATFYHPVLGKIWLSANLTINGSIDEISTGLLSFYDAVDGEISLFDVHYAYDAAYNNNEGANTYYIDGPGDFEETGHIVEGVYTPDSN